VADDRVFDDVSAELADHSLVQHYISLVTLQENALSFDHEAQKDIDPAVLATLPRPESG